jgi:hypothetical protein
MSQTTTTSQPKDDVNLISSKLEATKISLPSEETMKSIQVLAPEPSVAEPAAAEPAASEPAAAEPAAAEPAAAGTVGEATNVAKVEPSRSPYIPNPLAKPWVSKKASRELPEVKKSEAYLAEEKNFSRDSRDNLLYKGRPVCRYLNTARGCQLGDRCRFKHIALGCVFNQSSAQGCCFGDEGVGCAFSHDANAIVVAPPLVACLGNNCTRSCMSTSSVCRRCWNGMARSRRATAQQVTNVRKQTFKAHIGAGHFQDAGWQSARHPRQHMPPQLPIYYSNPVAQGFGQSPSVFFSQGKGRASRAPPVYRMPRQS